MTSPTSQHPHRFLRWLAICLVLLGLASTPDSPGAAPTAAIHQIASFQLPDQFGTNHTVRFPRTRPLLLLVGDRRGSEEIDAWIEPLKQRWKDVADIHGIADVQAVPRFLRGRVTEAIRRSRPKPLLLDFEGRVTGGLPCEKKAANVFAVGRDGRLLGHVSGPYQPGTNADHQLAVLEQALASP